MSLLLTSSHCLLVFTISHCLYLNVTSAMYWHFDNWWIQISSVIDNLDQFPECIHPARKANTIVRMISKCLLTVALPYEGGLPLCVLLIIGYCSVSIWYRQFDTVKLIPSSWYYQSQRSVSKRALHSSPWPYALQVTYAYCSSVIFLCLNDVRFPT